MIPALGGLAAAFEIMIVNSAIQNMIREGKVHQMDNVIYAGASEGMVTMDADIRLRLYQQKRISPGKRACTRPIPICSAGGWDDGA